MKSRSWLILAILTIAAMVFSACAAAPAAAPGGEAAAPGEAEAASAGDLTQPHPYLSNVNVRRAIAHCIDRDSLIAAAYPFVPEDVRPTMRMDSPWPKTHWVWQGPYPDYEYDVAKGNALLDEAGFTDDDGDGYRFELTLTTTNSQLRQTWAAVAEQNLADCGILLIRQHTPASWWFGDTTGLQVRDFELGAYAWVGESEPLGRTLYACDQIPTPANNWEGQNVMGWCNQVASDAIVLATNTLDREGRKVAYDTFQKEFGTDMVSIPLFQRAEAEAWSLNLDGLRLSPTEYGTVSAKDWALKDGGDTVVVGFSQEPASLNTLVESAAVAVQASHLSQGVIASQYDYDFQPVLQEQLSTIENGLATNEMVPVKEGDMVYDVSGQPVTLTVGTEVIVDGAPTAWDGTSELSLPQLVVTYAFQPYTWSDGTPGSVEDLKLGMAYNCDPESGATEFITCNAIQNVEYADDGSISYTITYVPGFQDPTYFLPPNWKTGKAMYPSHRILSDGRALKDLPAAEWLTTPEIFEQSLSFGPFVLKEWVKGQSMTFEANPYYYGEAPKVERIVILFVQDTMQAAAQLISGDVDYLEKATLGGGPEVELLLGAKDEGKVNIEISPNPTWEHIDMNMFVKEK